MTEKYQKYCNALKAPTELLHRDFIKSIYSTLMKETSYSTTYLLRPTLYFYKYICSADVGIGLEVNIIVRIDTCKEVKARPVQ